MDTNNRFAPPKTDLGLGNEWVPGPDLWNPNAAANWCLLFTPIFGAWLHMENWKSLGENGKAATARAWLVVSAVLLVGVTTAAAVSPRMPIVLLPRLVGFVLLVSWYFLAAREQARYVKQHFGEAYHRKEWGIPIVIAIAVIVLDMFVLSIVTSYSVGSR